MLLKINRDQGKVEPEMWLIPLRGAANAFLSTILEEMEQGRSYYSNVPVTLNKT